MATEKQKEAARRNLDKARSAHDAPAPGGGASPGHQSPGHQSSGHQSSGHQSSGYQSEGARSTAEGMLDDEEFAFPAQRKEPLTDAGHVRNAVARFNQVEDVSDADRDQAWERIRSAARKYDVDLSEQSWRHLAQGGNDT